MGNRVPYWLAQGLIRVLKHQTARFTGFSNEGLLGVTRVRDGLTSKGGCNAGIGKINPKP